jgi:hypothetical protein
MLNDGIRGSSSVRKQGGQEAIIIIKMTTVSTNVAMRWKKCIEFFMVVLFAMHNGHVHILTSTIL